MFYHVPISTKDLIASSWILFRFINSHKLTLSIGSLKAYALMKPISPIDNQFNFKILKIITFKGPINHAHLGSITM
jgi:hypothetical protein